MLSRLRRRRAAAPRLSVVVPVYNVERYLAECLESILAQTFDDLEILLVDDGSTDGSVAVAKEYVRRHRQVRMIHQANAGLGAARNTGVRHVSGELLAFVDSDDAIPPYAYELMVGTLTKSGSDFVVGSVEQGIPGDASEPAWLKRIHQSRLVGVRVEDHPHVIHDIFAWNKVYRRSFWDRAELSFPEGVRYEDQVALTRAYLLADRVDVLVRPVYLWRVRVDGSSITQRRHELADLQDRVETKVMTSQVVDELATPRLREQWRRQGLPGDLPVYFREIPTCDDAYWDLLHTGMQRMVDIDEIARWWLPAPQRLTGWLVAAGRRDEAVAVAEHLASCPRGIALEVRGDESVALLPYVDESRGIPAELYRLADHEIVFDARLIDARLEDQHLVVDGWALLRGAPPADLPTSLEATWRHDDGREVGADVDEWRSEEIDAWMDREHQRFDRSGFTARVPLTALIDTGDPARRSPAPWRILLRRQVSAVAREGTFRSRTVGIDGTAPPLPEGPYAGRWIDAVFDPSAGGLRVGVRALELTDVG